LFGMRNDLNEELKQITSKFLLNKLFYLKLV